MKKNYTKTLALLFLSIVSMSLNAQFSGAFAPASWGTVAANSNGLTYTVGAPASVSMSSSDGLIGAGTNDFTITMPASGVISFSWSYSTVDGPSWDYPMVLVNGVASMLNGYNIGGGATQTGTHGGICINAGQVFGFRMYSVDNAAGPCGTDFSNFIFTPAALTITASSPSICPGETVAVTASGGSSYNWSHGISNGVAFTPTTTVYTVTSVIAGCSMTKTYTPTFFPKITVNTPSNPICSGVNLMLTASGGTVYSWNTGPSTNTISVAPTSQTSYTVSGTTSDGCASSAAITISVNPGPPVLSVVSSTNSTCNGKTATLTASGALTYTWSHGVTNGVSFFPTTTTNYTVSGQNACGITQSVTTITIIPLPLSMALVPTLYCTNRTATLTATSPGTSYTWNPGNIVNTSPVMIVNPSVTTVYTITVSDGTCQGTSTVQLVANQVPTIVASASSTLVCPGSTVNLSATGGINYTWSPIGLSGNSVVFSPTATNVYNVTGDNAVGCVSSAAQIVIIGAQPTLVLTSSNSTICAGQSATLTVGGADTYAWSNGPTTTVNVVSPTLFTAYTVVGTNTTSTCSDTQIVNVDVFTPMLTITGNTAICAGGSGSISASGATSYTWEPGNVPFQGLSIAPTASTIYTVSAISTSNTINCPVVGTFTVIVNPNPTVTAIPTKTAVCPKEVNTFTAGGAASYTWTAASGATTTANTITVSSNAAAVLLYTVTGRDTEGCETNLVVPMSISPCTGIDQLSANNLQLQVYPNPNNGDFTLKANEDLEIRLINGLGQEVMKTSLNSENDHSARLNNLATGIYFVTSTKGSLKVVVTK